MASVTQFTDRVIQNVETVIVGKRQQIEFLMVALLCQGHVLIEDVPGTGKTMLARATAASMGLGFKRLQCTPDLLPNDITGVSVFNQGTGQFGFRPFLLILFIVAVWLRVSIFFTVLYLFLALALMSRLWMRRRVERVHAERRFVDRAFFGDHVTVELVLRNTGWLPVPWLEVHESLPVQLTLAPFQREAVSLGPFERRRFRYTLECRKRGYYDVGPLTMQGGDLLGLERSSGRWVAPDALIVYPRVVPLAGLGLPTHSPQVALPAKAPLFEDPARIIGVRDYQQGDSPRRIRWTATASAGRLLVKQYQPAIARETLICLDLDKDNYGGGHGDRVGHRGRGLGGELYHRPRRAAGGIDHRGGRPAVGGSGPIFPAAALGTRAPDEPAGGAGSRSGRHGDVVH